MQLFRPRYRFAVYEAIAALLGVPLLAAWPLRTVENKSTAYLVAVGLVVLWLLFAGGYFWKLYRIRRERWLQLDGQAISGFVGGRPFYLAWGDVSAVFQHQEGHGGRFHTVFYFTTKDGVMAIPIDRSLDTAPIWRLIEAAVGTEALTAGMAQSALGLTVQGQSMEGRLPLQVADHLAFWWVGCIALALLPLGAWYDWQDGRLSATPVAAFIAVLGVWLLLRYGRTQIEETHVRRITPLGRYEIGWDEINRVEFYGTQAIVLRGSYKSLVIPGAISMAATNRPETVAFIKAQILSRSIPTGTASFWAMSKNTRVSGGGC